MPLTLDRNSVGPAASKKWDAEILVYLGALLGTAVGCLYEVTEAIFHDMGEVEPFAQIMGEIAASALASAALFAAVAVVRNWRLMFD